MKNRFKPLALIALGLILLISGFVYDLLFAGIPYQDPTPEMTANYTFHSHVASTFYLFGLLTLLCGCVARLIGRIK